MAQTQTAVAHSKPPGRKLRSIGAVVAGVVVVVLLSTVTDMILHAIGVFPAPGQPMDDKLWLLATAYRFVYGAVGGFVTATLAPKRHMMHAMIYGLVGVLASALGAVATWDKGLGFGPHWYPLSLVIHSVPSAYLGAIMRRDPFVGRT